MKNSNFFRNLQILLKVSFLITILPSMRLTALDILPNVGIQYGSPVRLSGEIGTLFAFLKQSEASVKNYGLRIAAEGGLSGSKAIIGFGVTGQPLPSNRHGLPYHFSFNFYFLRTYNDPIALQTNNNHWGFELRAAMLLGGKIGVIFGDSPVFTFAFGLII